MGWPKGKPRKPKDGSAATDEDEIEEDSDLVEEGEIKSGRASLHRNEHERLHEG